MTLSRLHTLLLLAALFAPGSPALAEPCLRELCVGDALAQTRVEWESRRRDVLEGRRIRRLLQLQPDTQRAMADRVFPGLSESDVQITASHRDYFGTWLLDRRSAPAFTRPETICSFESLVGTFRSAPGQRTEVTFSPRPGPGGAAHFSVALIERQFSGLRSWSEDGQATLRSATRRFGPVCSLKQAVFGDCQGVVWYDDPRGLVLQLSDPELHAVSGQRQLQHEMTARLAEQPGCAQLYARE